jgi:uncharacterized membrane protein YqjE
MGTSSQEPLFQSPLRPPERPIERPIDRPPERSIGELFSDLANETSTLIRQEVKLAATEMTQKATFAGKQIVYVAIGLLLGVVSLLALIGALIFGLATMIALWKSALVVGIVAALIALAVIWKGAAALRDMRLVPRQTLLSIKEDKQWLENQVR